MASVKAPFAVVCKFPFPVEGRPAFYLVDWKGFEHELRVVGEDETEREVIEELREEAGPSPSRSGGRRSQRPDRPPLFLL